MVDIFKTIKGKGLAFGNPGILLKVRTLIFKATYTYILNKAVFKENIFIKKRYITVALAFLAVGKPFINQSAFSR